MKTCSGAHWTGVVILVFFCSSVRANLPDYSGKVNVRVREVLKGAGAEGGEGERKSSVHAPPAAIYDQSWSTVDVRVMGRSVDPAVLYTLKPDATRLKPRKMQRILDTDFEPDWMSIEQPAQSKQTKMNSGGSATPRPSPILSNSTKLLEASRRLNITFVDKSGVALELQPTMLDMLRKWMVEQASCPMDFVWEDLSVLFWPRWIKRGVCLNTKSCSWPSGMRCRPGKARQLKILRWTCANDSNGSLAKRNAPEPRRPRRRGTRSGGAEGRKGRRNRRRNRNPGRGRGRGKRNTVKKRRRRAKQLIRRMSLSAHGYYCNWVLHQYAVTDHCMCDCAS